MLPSPGCELAVLSPCVMPSSLQSGRAGGAGAGARPRAAVVQAASVWVVRLCWCQVPSLHTQPWCVGSTGMAGAWLSLSLSLTSGRFKRLCGQAETSLRLCAPRKGLTERGSMAKAAAAPGSCSECFWGVGSSLAVPQLRAMTKQSWERSCAELPAEVVLATAGMRDPWGLPGWAQSQRAIRALQEPSNCQ